jgi:hypothetical protein
MLINMKFGSISLHKLLCDSSNANTLLITDSFFVKLLTKTKKKTKLRGFSPQANYTDQATAACRRS